MRNVLRFIGFYAVGCIIYLIISFLFAEYISTNFKRWQPWIIILAVTIVGYLLNFRSSTYNSQDKTKVPVVGYVLALGAFVVWSFYTSYQNWYHEKYKANAEQNESALKNLDYQDEETVKIAFKDLLAKFDNLNDFRLHRCYVDKKDTLVNNGSVVVKNVYFYYYLGHNFKDEYKALIAVYGKHPNLLTFNEVSFEKLPLDNPNSFTYFNKEGLDTFNSLSEATKHKLVDTMKKHFR